MLAFSGYSQTSLGQQSDPSVSPLETLDDEPKLLLGTNACFGYSTTGPSDVSISTNTYNLGIGFLAQYYIFTAMAVGAILNYELDRLANNGDNFSSSFQQNKFQFCPFLSLYPALLCGAQAASVRPYARLQFGVSFGNAVSENDFGENRDNLSEFQAGVALGGTFRLKNNCFMNLQAFIFNFSRTTLTNPDTNEGVSSNLISGGLNKGVSLEFLRKF